MRTIRLTVEYAGAGFHGWQVQPRLRTVQGELATALATVLRHPVQLAGAGRTDAGVHAVGQVASLRTQSELPLQRLARGVNALTGPDLAVREAREEAPDFHARHSARARHYTYLLIDAPSALWAGRALAARRWPDRQRMAAAVAHLVGDHDFAGFSCASAEQRGTRSRILYARWEAWDRGLAFQIGAVRFLYKMVRCIVTGSLAVGLGERDPDWFRALRDAPPGRATSVAPAHGLYLVAVDYATARTTPPGHLDCLL